MAPNFYYTPNPMFDTQMRSAVKAALNEKLVAAYGYARASASWSGSIPGTIVVDGAKDYLGGVAGAIHYRRGLGPIFESGTKARYTKKGAYRGKVEAKPAIGPAVARIVQEGLPLYKYL